MKRVVFGINLIVQMLADITDPGRVKLGCAKNMGLNVLMNDFKNIFVIKKVIEIDFFE